MADAKAASLADAGMAFPANPARVVTVGVASLADAGVAFPADLAGIVTVGVNYLADAGAESLANAGAASLVDLAGSVAGGVTDLNVLAPVETEEMPLLQGCIVQNGLV